MKHNKNIRIINIIRIRKEINEHIVIASKRRLTGNELIKKKKQLPIIVNKNKEQKIRKYVIVITKSEQEKQVYQIS